MSKRNLMELSSADGAQTSLPSAFPRRVSSKEEMSNANTSTKKRASTKEDFPQDVAPVLKRSNSKEDVKKVVPLAEAPNAGGMTKMKQKKSFLLLDLAGLEKALTDTKKVKRAIAAAQLTHCDEGLLFLQFLHKWEAQKPGKIKRAMTKKMLHEFVQPQSAHEIVLPEQLRKKLLASGENNRIQSEDILEAKKCILNDIRFNDRVMQALSL
jgi:hypothetical protein